MRARSRSRPLSHWLLLFSLVALWGTAFALTSIAVRGFSPSALVSFRLIVAAILLTVGVIVLRKAWPRQKRFWWFCAVLALTGNCMPFWLLSTAQQYIDSGLAGILMAIMPLSTMVLAHFFVADERLTVGKLIGCLIGFVGIVVLIGPDALAQLGGVNGQFWYQLAALGAALCYAVNAIIARHRPSADVLAATAGVMVLGGVFSLPLGGIELSQQLTTVTSGVLLAAAALAVFCTALATVIFLRLVVLAGPSFVSFINYLIPLWALLVGIVFLSETPRWSSLAALVLILGGIAISETWGQRSK